MVIGKDARRQDRSDRVTAKFPKDAAAVLDLLALTDMAWHDSYGDLELPAGVVDDLLVVSSTLAELISAASLALTDWRDLRVNADDFRKRAGR